MSYKGAYYTCYGCVEDFEEDEITWIDNRAFCADCVLVTIKLSQEHAEILLGFLGELLDNHQVSGIENETLGRTYSQIYNQIIGNQIIGEQNA